MSTMLKKAVYKFAIRSRLEEVGRVVEMRTRFSSRTEIERYQVGKFNEVWNTASANVPFYRAWRGDFGLPASISDLGELSSWPILAKSDLRDLAKFTRTDIPMPKGWTITGGSTGEPVRLPSFGDSRSGVSQCLGRMQYGIEPGARTFLLWGHEHLYGTGFGRTLSILKRRIKDWLGDWLRVSAYDLGECAMRLAYRRFEAFKPEFVIGFSPAVLAFVRINKAKAGRVKSVKSVLCTAGPLDLSEKEEIARFFGSSVCMEYGSAECGLMAHTRPMDGKYDVSWDTHLLQGVRQSDGEMKNIVTRFSRLYVPLIRYDIGDYLKADTSDDAVNERSVLEFEIVKGRPSEMICFKCGVAFFGALVGDCVKQIPEVVSSQIAVDECGDALQIRVTATESLPESAKRLIAGRFNAVVAGADRLRLSVVQVERLETTIGGKTPRVVRLAIGTRH